MEWTCIHLPAPTSKEQRNETRGLGIAHAQQLHKGIGRKSCITGLCNGGNVGLKSQVENAHSH